MRQGWKMTTNDADWKKHPYYNQDPFPGILPALLNSADIEKYVDEECLLEKSSFDRERMKPASYEMRFLGQLYHWEQADGKLEKKDEEVSDGQVIMLKKNSISYLWTQERLRLPEYIAARFNLRISDVHKGILLGTGPLIDPGFSGRLLIPLHNLTDVDYQFKGGDGIIWVEFTKVSRNTYWTSWKSKGGTKRPPKERPPEERPPKERPPEERPPKLVEFPDKKAINDPGKYLRKAGVTGVQSAFKGALEGARSKSKKAIEKVDQLEQRLKKYRLYAIIVSSLSVALLFLATFTLVLSAYHLIFQIGEKVRSQDDRIFMLEKRLEDIIEAPPQRRPETVQPVEATKTPSEPEKPTSSKVAP